MILSGPVGRLDLGPTESLLLQKRRTQGTLLAALIDPEDFSVDEAISVVERAERVGASLILIGGSTIADQQHLDDVVIQIKSRITLPVILFPGNITGISNHADAILFSSLLNSTNTYFIIGAQAIGAMQVKKCGLEAIPMGYLVFGQDSTTGFVGQIREMPRNKPAIAVMYSMAAHYLGMRTLYLEAGSGSANIIPKEIVSAVRKHYPGLLIVGGGVTDSESAKAIAEAGADIIVIGNMLRSSDFEGKLNQIVQAIKKSS